MTPAADLSAEDRNRQIRVAKLILALEVQLSTRYAAEHGTDPGMLTLMRLKRDWHAGVPARIRWGTLAALANLTELSAPTVALAETTIETQVTMFTACEARDDDEHAAGAARVLHLVD